MKRITKNLLPFLIFTLCWTNSHAQWTQINSGTTNDLYDVYFPTNNIGYAVGYYGTILKTTDAGTSWIPLNSNTIANLYGVEFLNPTTGFAVGDSILIKTTDGGISWNPVSIPVVSSLKDIEFINSQTGFCVGRSALKGTILKTTDGGNTWGIIPIPSGNDYFSSINFPTDSIGYIVTTNYNWELKKTIDGGNTWSNIPIHPDNSYSNLESIFFTDANTGYIGGWYLPTFIKTSDGGSNWVDKNINDSIGTSCNPYSIYFPSANVGYAVGVYSGIIKTNDGGNTFTWQYVPIGIETLYSVYCTNEENAYIVGTNGIILKTNNGGAVAGTDDIKNSEKDIVVFPNPTNYELNIQNNTNQVIHFSIFNSAGEKVTDKLLNNKNSSINISSYSNGIYIYKVSTDENFIKSGEIIKQ